VTDKNKVAQELLKLAKRLQGAPVNREVLKSIMEGHKHLDEAHSVLEKVAESYDWDTDALNAWVSLDQAFDMLRSEIKRFGNALRGR